MMYPIPFAKPSDIVPTALLAERLGYDSVGGNDHMTAQRYVQREFDTPPNFYEPLVTFTWVAARTTRLKVGTCILVLPMRHMVVAAKQAATLDQLSGGRLILGVGAGAYREEYEALFPDARGAHRGTIVDAGMNIRAYENAGVTTFARMLSVASTLSEMWDAIELFGREVLPSFTSARPYGGPFRGPPCP